ncbi:hypothetical protein FOZ60_009572 [Perkinsus olseni]|uniref:TRUD domain-containing protein n=1 Tax=Perkinsus olseni TaxID=32597 RepID=A0A7J6NH25_PEROL|nr:hypothetical protein FOZ60_009572 [Perkinsus olseni]
MVLTPRLHSNKVCCSPHCVTLASRRLVCGRVAERQTRASPDSAVSAVNGNPVPEARGPKFTKFFEKVGVEEFIDPLHIGGVMKARFIDWEVREVGMDGRVARMPEDEAPEWWGASEPAEKESVGTESREANAYHCGSDGVDQTELYRRAYEDGYLLGDNAAEFVREKCGTGAFENIVKFSNSTQKGAVLALGDAVSENIWKAHPQATKESGSADHRRRLFEWKFDGGVEAMAAAYKIRGAIAGLLRESLAVVPFKLLSDKVIYYAAVNAERNQFLLSCMDQWEAARVLYFFGAGYSSETLLVHLGRSKASREGWQLISKLRREFPSYFPDVRVDVHERETESSGAVVELSWSRKYSPVGLYKGSRWKFVLVKAGWDTTAIQRAIERRLDLPKDTMHFAGVKDKFGVTYQFATLPVTHSERQLREAVDSINARMRSRDMFVKVSGFEREYVEGIRDVEEGSAEKLRASKLAETGFINYYGLQRFGINPHHDESRHSNVDIGAALVSGDYERAARLILTPAASDGRDVAEVLREWQVTGDSSVAVGELQKIRSRDRDVEMWSRMMSAIATQPSADGYRRSLRTGVPRSILQIHFLAYQSCLWNRMASRRIRECGLEVVPGDVVWCKEKGDITVVDSSRERYSIDDVLVPTWGSQLEGKDKLLKLGINTRHVYAELLKDSVSRGEASDSILREDLDLDFSRSLGVRARLPSIPRRLVAKPQGLNCWEEAEEEKRNLMLEFFLPRGCYATMLLREIMEEGAELATSTQSMSGANHLVAGFLQIGGVVVRRMSDGVYTLPLDLNALGYHFDRLDFGILQIAAFNHGDVEMSNSATRMIVAPRRAQVLCTVTLTPIQRTSVGIFNNFSHVTCAFAL